jgi:hypothetical protein
MGAVHATAGRLLRLDSLASMAQQLHHGGWQTAHQRELKSASTFQYSSSTTAAAMMDATSPCSWLRVNHSTATAICAARRHGILGAPHTAMCRTLTDTELSIACGAGALVMCRPQCSWRRV